jgi:hypothetical protein
MKKVIYRQAYPKRLIIALALSLFPLLARAQNDSSATSTKEENSSSGHETIKRETNEQSVFQSSSNEISNSLFCLTWDGHDVSVQTLKAKEEFLLGEANIFFEDGKTIALNLYDQENKIFLMSASISKDSTNGEKRCFISKIIHSNGCDKSFKLISLERIDINFTEKTFKSTNGGVVSGCAESISSNQMDQPRRFPMEELRKLAPSGADSYQVQK